MLRLVVTSARWRLLLRVLAPPRFSGAGPLSRFELAMMAAWAAAGALGTMPGRAKVTARAMRWARLVLADPRERAAAEVVLPDPMVWTLHRPA